MGMRIGSGKSNVQRIVFRNADGTETGSMTIRKASTKKTRRLQYNFKEISALILRTKTSGSARQVVSRARGRTALLKQRLRAGEYDEQELQNAIFHAEKMERIARKKMRHLQEEELAKKAEPCEEAAEENRQDVPTDPEETGQETDFRMHRQQQEAMRREQQYRMEKLMQELMEKTQQELTELSGMEELSDALGGKTTDMDSGELEQLKKKHRLEEQREILEADMLYLKAFFQKLAQEKQESTGSSESGVSLELGGMEMPLPETETPVMPEGGAFDAIV